MNATRSKRLRTWTTQTDDYTSYGKARLYARCEATRKSGKNLVTGEMKLAHLELFRVRRVGLKPVQCLSESVYRVGYVMRTRRRVESATVFVLLHVVAGPRE